MNKKIAIRGTDDIKDGRKIIRLLQSLGGLYSSLIGNLTNEYYHLTSNNEICASTKKQLDSDYELYESIKDYEKSINQDKLINYQEI